MSALAIVTTLLRRDGPLAGHVADRVFPVVAPQGAARPYVIARTIAEDDEQILSGAARYYESRVEVQVIADSATTADAIGEVVKTALEDVTAMTVLDDASPAGTIATSVTIVKAGADVSDHSADRTVFRRVLDFTVRWRP